MYINPNIRRLVMQFGLLAVVPGFAWSQIALVNVTSCGPVALPGSCTIPATGGGHLIVVGFELEGIAAPTVTSVIDSAGNTYAEAGAARSIDASGPDAVDIWYAKNSVAAATSITVTVSAVVSRCAIVIWEFSGADPTAPLDQTAVLNTQAATATPSGAPVTITSANEVVISLANVYNAVTGIVPGNPFITDATLASGGWAHLITSSTGTYSAQWTQNTAGAYASSTASFKAAASGTTPLNACDLAAPFGTIDAADVQAILNMTLGISPCTANIDGPGLCNAAVVQRVIDAALGGACNTGPGAVAHYVSLSWTASTTPNVTYNVYRTTTSGVYSPTPLASAGAATSYTDNTVSAGVTYYYVVTAASGGSESIHSNEAPATIPTP